MVGGLLVALLVAFPALARADSVRLDNGVLLVIEPDPAAQHATVGVSVRAGPSDDPAGQEGLSRLTERVVLEATRGDPQTTGALQPTHVVHDREVTTFVDVLPPEQLELGVWLAALRLLPVEASPSRVAVLGAMLAEEHHSREARDIVWTARQRLASLALAGHPRFGRPALAGLGRIGAVDVMSFHRTRYGPSQAVVTVTGAVEPARALATARRYLETLSGAAAPEPERARLREQQSARVTTLHSTGAHTNALAYGWAIEPSDAGERAATELALELLASDLTQQLVWADADALSVAIEVLELGGLMVAGLAIELPPRRLPGEVSAVMEQHVRRLASRAPSAEELAGAIARRRVALLARLEDPAERAHFLARAALGVEGARSVADKLADFEQVSADRIRRAALRWFVPSRATQVEALHAPIAGPIARGDEASAKAGPGAAQPKKASQQKKTRQKKRAAPPSKAGKSSSKQRNKPGKSSSKRRSRPR